jgi:hypothetical protein
VPTEPPAPPGPTAPCGTCPCCESTPGCGIGVNCETCYDSSCNSLGCICY